MQPVIHNESLTRATIPCGGGALARTPANESIGERLTPAAIAAGWRYCIEAPAIAHQKSESWTDDGTTMTQLRTPYTAEEIAAQEAQAAADAEANRLAWLSMQRDIDQAELRTRALALVLLDEHNRASTWLRSFVAAVAASTSLLNLQSRVATLAAMPDRTAAQLRQAVIDKAQELQ